MDSIGYENIFIRLHIYTEVLKSQNTVILMYVHVCISDVYVQKPKSIYSPYVWF